MPSCLFVSKNITNQSNNNIVFNLVTVKLIIVRTDCGSQWTNKVTCTPLKQVLFYIINNKIVNQFILKKLEINHLFASYIEHSFFCNLILCMCTCHRCLSIFFSNYSEKNETYLLNDIVSIYLNAQYTIVLWN